jgi:hypothetical protein
VDESGSKYIDWDPDRSRRRCWRARIDTRGLPRVSRPSVSTKRPGASLSLALTAKADSPALLRGWRHDGSDGLEHQLTRGAPGARGTRSPPSAPHPLSPPPSRRHKPTMPLAAAREDVRAAVPVVPSPFESTPGDVPGGWSSQPSPIRGCRRRAPNPASHSTRTSHIPRTRIRGRSQLRPPSFRRAPDSSTHSDRTWPSVGDYITQPIRDLLCPPGRRGFRPPIAVAAWMAWGLPEAPRAS